ncbi:uncharacterized protein LOC107401153 isoform X3 [Peromyscus maniculatus bairdii]|uniref:uncharacterized protein LOC107401153 isoform X3 n=1 Tax=Peromyscus maniculatus bairdii TaxID=230844 RepID=UPI003FD5791D
MLGAGSACTPSLRRRLWGATAGDGCEQLPFGSSKRLVEFELLRWAGGCSTLPPSLCPVDVRTSDIQHHGQLLAASGSVSSTPSVST